MSLLTTCCCCCNVRTGSLIVVIYTLILSCLEATLNVLLIVFGFYTPVGYICLIVYAVVFAAVFTTSIVLLFGILKDIAVLFLPWMLCIIVTVISTLVVVIVLLAARFSIFSLVYLGLWIVTSCFNIYGLLIVLSHYQDVKAGKRGTGRHHGQGTDESKGGQSRQSGLTEQAFESHPEKSEKPTASASNTRV